jgi:hypothetical protein
MLVRLREEGPEATLVEVPGAGGVVVGVRALRVRMRQPAKEDGKRRVLFKLSKVAERCRCTIICMRHLNKGSGTKATYRGNSSIGVIGHARAGLLVAQDPDNPKARILAMSKCNLAAMPKLSQTVG